jgi:hypothetical protein
MAEGKVDEGKLSCSQAEDKEGADYKTISKQIETCLDLFQSLGSFTKNTLSGPD